MSHDRMSPEEYRRSLNRAFGSMPWLKPQDIKRFRVKVFKSGNSLALRLPAGLGLEAGTEMNLRVEDDHFSFEPVEAIKRKVNVAKFWGSVPGLELIKPEDRVFEPSRRVWDEPGPDHRDADK